MKLTNKVALLKTKFARANYSNFVTNDVIKAIIGRTNLRKQILKKRTSLARTNQRSFCLIFLKIAVGNYYKNLDLKDIPDKNKFWANVKPVFSNKIEPAENFLERVRGD